MSLKAVHYINQFYAGIGGEEIAHEGLRVYDGVKGPGLGLEKEWQGEMTIVKTLACGDNSFNLEENFEAVKDQLLREVKDVSPDVVIAGPAFNAGRYGVACGKFVTFIQEELGIPGVTAMFPANPGAEMYAQHTYVIDTPETAVGMRKALPALASLALKLAKGEPVGTAAAEGYLPTGKRKNELDDKSAAQRAVAMLLDKLYGRPYRTEVPSRSLDLVPPAPPITDPSKLKFAIVTTGGLVPKGNPDKLKQYASVTYGTYPIDLATWNSDHYETIHGGYDTAAVNKDPQRLVPYTAALTLKDRKSVV